jgi:hypothetical protein
MTCTIPLSTACPVVKYFSTVSHKSTTKKKVIGHKI